jgi:hypothetical protein
MTMKTDNYIYLNRKAVLVAMISAAFPIGVNAAAGKVEFASGGAAVQAADGSSKILTKGMEINQGDTILTGAGRAQVKFTDGGYISFQPNTQFKVEEYNFSGKQDGTEKGFFRLVEGGLRAITGLVGRQNRPAYRMATPVATIGIRGTYYLAEFREKLKTHVGQGSVYIFNDQGDIVLFAGQSAEVGAGEAPKYSDKEMTLGAKGPEGGQPQESQEQQQSENENSEVFKVSEILTDDGAPASIPADAFKDTSISAVIANLNGINAEGVYHLDPNVVQAGGNSVYNTDIYSGTIFAQFGPRTITGDLTFKSTVAAGTSYFDSFSISGSILNSGSFSASGSTSGGFGPCYSGCNLNVIGLFSGAQAEKASVGYTINGSIPGGQITGTAGFVANPPPSPGAINRYIMSQ